MNSGLAPERLNSPTDFGLCRGRQGVRRTQKRTDGQFQHPCGVAQSGKAEGCARARQAVRTAFQAGQRLRWRLVVQHLAPERLDLLQLLGQRTAVISTQLFQKCSKRRMGGSHDSRTVAVGFMPTEATRPQRTGIPNLSPATAGVGSVALSKNLASWPLQVVSMHNKLATYGVSKFLKTLNATEPSSLNCLGCL